MFKQLRNRWEDERPKYQALCCRIKKEIRLASKHRGIECHITARTKEIDSFIKKAIRKSYSNPFEDIHDKAGVRVVCTYSDSLKLFKELIFELFDICSYEDKTASLASDQFGYSGIHFEVQLSAENLDQCQTDELAGLLCEIQLLTRAQSLWADVSHELAYKPSQEPPPDIRRLIHLQSALVELFDNQIAEARRVMLGLSGFPERQILDALDRHYFRLTAREYDRELSLHILEHIHVLLSEDELDNFTNDLDDFIESKKDMIDSVFRDYANDDSVTPLLFQPESLFVFMCMERNPFLLKNTWGQFLPLEYLQYLADVWGVDIGTIE